MTSAQRMAISAVTLLLIAFMIAVFALNGYPPLIAAFAGVWWGLGPVVLLLAA